MIRFHFNKLLHGQDGKLPLSVSGAINDGAIVALYGASGAGKTTTLRMLAGLLQPDEGHITVNNELWLDTQRKINIPPQKRGIGFVFQDYALFPNMTALQNLEYALEKGQDKKYIDELVEVMDLQQLKNHRPGSLSGGQKQRVALARALVRQPKLLLLDEPLAALDTEMRQKLQSHILTIHKTYQLTIILVSHDIAEIHKMCDHVLVLEHGSIARQGAPATIFPSDTFEIRGTVSGIRMQGDRYIVTIVCTENSIDLNVGKGDLMGLECGDAVLIAKRQRGGVYEENRGQ